MASVMFGEALNIQVLLEHLLGHAVDVDFRQDNETLLKILVAVYSAKLRHCNRVHRINIASMSEQLAEPRISARYCKSEDQVSNGLTKIIASAQSGLISWSSLVCSHLVLVSAQMQPAPPLMSPCQQRSSRPSLLTPQHNIWCNCLRFFLTTGTQEE